MHQIQVTYRTLLTRTKAAAMAGGAATHRFVIALVSAVHLLAELLDAEVVERAALENIAGSMPAALAANLPAPP